LDKLNQYLGSVCVALHSDAGSMLIRNDPYDCQSQPAAGVCGGITSTLMLIDIASRSGDWLPRDASGFSGLVPSGGEPVERWFGS